MLMVISLSFICVLIIDSQVVNAQADPNMWRGATPQARQTTQDLQDSGVAVPGAPATGNEVNGEASTIARFLSWILYWFAASFSVIVAFLIDILIRYIISFNNFLNVGIVKQGWEITRNVCNNFFIIILLVISVSTVLRIQKYYYRTWLPKLLLMAILINFSKMFTGILIDFSQVIMLWLATPLRTLGSGAVLNALGLSELYDFSNRPEKFRGSWDVVLALVFALIIAVVATVVIACIMIILVYRIVMLWILIILSPLAYVAQAYPGGSGYAADWWKRLSQQLIVGPVMLFFLYLAFSAKSTDGSISTYQDTGGEGRSEVTDLTSDTKQGEKIIGTNFSEPANFIDFLMILGLLICSLIMGQQTGAAGTAWAGKALNMGKSALNKSANWGKKKAMGAAVGAAKSVGTGVKAVGKGLDYASKGALTRAATGVKEFGKGAAPGAAVGAVLAGPAGAAIGAGVSGVLNMAFGKKFKDGSDRSRKIKDEVWKANSKGDKGFYVDEDGKKVDSADKAAYAWDDKSATYKKKGANGQFDGEALKDEAGMNVGRFGDVEVDGKKWRRGKEDGSFRQIDSQGNIVGEETLKGRFGMRDVTGGKTSELAHRFWMGHSSVTGKSRSAAEATEAKKIEELQKDYSGMSKEMLSEMLEVEKDAAKKQAIALTLAIKKGFTDVKKLEAAKESFGGNDTLLKKFNESMNKNNAILNNSRIEKDAQGNEKVVVDWGEVSKVMDSGDAKWSSQNLKQLNKETLAGMADLLGKDFHKTLESMSKTTRDRAVIGRALSAGIQDRGFEGSDESIRKSAGSFTGDIPSAYQFKDENGQLQVNVPSLTKAFKDAPSKAYANFNEESFENEDVQKALAEGLDVNRIKSIARDNESQSKLEDIIKAIKAQAKKDNQKAKALIEQIRNSTLDIDVSDIEVDRPTPPIFGPDGRPYERN